jgi:large subunit ribosomal protein L34e
MPRGMYRSRTLRRKLVKTPGNRTVMHYIKRKPKKATCAKCKAVLPGVANERPVKMKNMAKTYKRPERPYGGVLCSRCMRALLKEKAKTVIKDD